MVKIKPLVCAKVFQTDVPDVMQDIRIALLISLPKYRGEAKMGTYVFAIARKRIADYWRSRYRSAKPITALTEDRLATVTIPKSRQEMDDPEFGWLTSAEK